MGKNNKGIVQLVMLAILMGLIAVLFFLFKKPVTEKQVTINPMTASTPTPTPNPFPYKIPLIQSSRSYRTMLVGDSMVAALGLNAQLLRQHLIEHYPNNEFVNYNYGFGATSIETLPKRLTEESEYEGQKFPSILTQGFELIIIGSFAYNPLSQEAQGEGVQKHIKILDESLRIIISEKPETAVAILTPIAPSKKHFARGVYDLSDKVRGEWAEERIEYIKAVIEYANEKNVPLINVYEKSLNETGEANLTYISSFDYIHPSAEGLDFMARTIADFIYENKIFPQ